MKKGSSVAQGAISDEITRHFEAALALSRRDFLRRLVHEAELCIEFDQASAAAILAGIVLEEIALLSDGEVDRTREPRLEAWRELRHRVAHPAAPGQEVDRKAVAAMIIGIQSFLEEVDGPHATARSSTLSQNVLTSVRGKYVFVPTSVEDFLRRKREEIALENPK